MRCVCRTQTDPLKTIAAWLLGSILFNLLFRRGQSGVFTPTSSMSLYGESTATTQVTAGEWLSNCRIKAADKENVKSLASAKRSL